MSTRALVLGGGGPVGIAWESGLAAGLESEGVRLADADVIIGTSAGSVVGAGLALGQSAQSLKQSQAAQAARAPARDVNPRGARAGGAMSGLMEFFAKRPSSESEMLAWRRDIGAFAMQSKTMSEEAFVESFGSVRGAQWPQRRFVATAVDAEGGDFVTWDNDSGVPLGRAVASSCSVPGIFPPITIKGRRYIDGGMRSATNADLARGYDRVVVISVIPAAAMESFGAALQKELDALRESGSAVELISPDTDSSKAMGANLMDASQRAAAADAGERQGRGEADRLRKFWNA